VPLIPKDSVVAQMEEENLRGPASLGSPCVGLYELLISFNQLLEITVITIIDLNELILHIILTTHVDWAGLKLCSCLPEVCMH